MRKIYILLLLFIIPSISISAQKKKKTYDYKVFAEKFTKFTRGDFISLMGYDKEMNYISDKTGKDVAELTKQRQKHYQDIKKEVSKTKAKGMLMNYKDAELIVKQETPIKVADIKILVNSGSEDYHFILKNCAQTNTTWVLGDAALAQGNMFETDEANETSLPKEKFYTASLKFDENLVGKPMKGYYITDKNEKINAVILNDDPNKLEDNNINLFIYKTAFNDANYTENDNNFIRQIPKNQLKAFYTGNNLYIKALDGWFILLNEAPIGKIGSIVKTSISTTPEKVEKRDLVGKPVRGWYIDNSGNKVNAVIKYQDAKQLQNMNSTFLLYNIAYNEKGFTEDESNNFKEILMKQKVKEFHLAGNTYYKTNPTAENPLGKWKVETNDASYSKNTYIYKKGETPEHEANLPLGFKNKMSKLTADNKELSTKIKNKEKGYKFMNLDKIIKEYNEWYIRQYPERFKSVFDGVSVKQENAVEETEENTAEDNAANENSTASPEFITYGKALLDALKEETPDKLLALSWTSNDLISTLKVKTQNKEMKDAFITRLNRKDPDNKAMQTEVKTQFAKLKQSNIYWKGAEFVDFKFERQGISDDVQFEWGKGILYFESQEQHHQLEIGDFMQLLNGWKGATYSIKE
jgi:hypothetical protein